MLQTINLTDNNPKLKEASERKAFLHRAVAHGNMTQEAMDQEMPALQAYIDSCTAKALLQCREHLQKEATVIKKEIPIDGDMKRAVASLLIKILKDVFPADEIRGIMRQGYKIMRNN